MRLSAVPSLCQVWWWSQHSSILNFDTQNKPQSPKRPSPFPSLAAPTSGPHIGHDPRLPSTKIRLCRQLQIAGASLTAVCMLCCALCCTCSHCGVSLSVHFTHRSEESKLEEYIKGISDSGAKVSRTQPNGMCAGDIRQQGVESLQDTAICVTHMLPLTLAQR
jgi:hypothetical protein